MYAQSARCRHVMEIKLCCFRSSNNRHGSEAVDEVSAAEANEKCPHIVIHFYTDGINWPRQLVMVERGEKEFS